MVYYIYNETKTVDPHILVYRLQLMGLGKTDGLEVHEYVQTITDTAASLEAKNVYADHLVKFYWSRETYAKLEKAKKYILSNQINELLNEEVNIEEAESFKQHSDRMFKLLSRLKIKS
mgnify:CR=1 FL=1